MTANVVIDNTKEIEKILLNSKRDGIIARIALVISILSLIIAIFK
jgi:hypothetical protein